MEPEEAFVYVGVCMCQGLGLLTGKEVMPMSERASGILAQCIYIVLYHSVIIQINCLDQMVGLSSHAVCLFVCK